MIISEKFLKGKFNDEQKCEDAIFISENFIAIIDGATSKAPNQAGDQITSGKRAGLLISEALPTVSPDADMLSTINSFNGLITGYYQQHQGIEHYRNNPTERLTASIVIYSKSKKELWMIGDCIALINGQLITNSKKPDEVCAQLRSAHISSLLAKGKATIGELLITDAGREFVLPLLKWATQFQNCGYEHEFAHSVIDGFPVSEKLTKCIKVDNGAKVVLCSDGYPEIKETLQEAEDVLEHILRNDPLCIDLFKSTKGLRKDSISFDDRSYISLVV